MNCQRMHMFGIFTVFFLKSTFGDQEEANINIVRGGPKETLLMILCLPHTHNHTNDGG